MNHRSVIRLSSAVLLAGLVLGCGDKEFPTQPDDFLTVTPAFAPLGEGETIQMRATLGIGGDPVPVTWESSHPARASVDANGLVTGLLACAGVPPTTPACTNSVISITATLASDPSVKRSANLGVAQLQGTQLTKGTGVTISSSGARGSSQLYRIFVPTGSTLLNVTLRGGTGDADIYVRRATPPTTNVPSGATGWSFNGGNDEDVPISNPQSGTWYILVDLWDPYAGAVLTANYTP